MGLLEWSLLVILSILWGGSFFFTEVALMDLTPLTIVLCRVGLAAITLALFFKVTRRNIGNLFTIWPIFLGMGLLNNVIPFTLLSFGQVHIASGLASILNAFTPVFTVIVAHFLTRDEKLAAHKVIGVLFGIAGVVLMIGTSALDGMSNALIGMILCLGATLSYAFAGVYGKRFKAMNIEPVGVALGQVTASTVLLLPIVLIIDQPWLLPMPSTETIASVFGIAVFSTSLAYILFFRILSTGGATNLSLVTLLIPASAIFLGSVVLGEQLASHHFIGFGLIIIGLIAMDGRVFRKRT